MLPWRLEVIGYGKKNLFWSRDRLDKHKFDCLGLGLGLWIASRLRLGLGFRLGFMKNRKNPRNVICLNWASDLVRAQRVTMNKLSPYTLGLTWRPQAIMFINGGMTCITSRSPLTFHYFL